VDTLTQTLEEALAELDRVAPSAPLLALGQTVFWDEPMKAGVAGLAKRPLIAGIHDTDYFAKLPGGRKSSRPYESVPHNDTYTKGLWSAAAEFSTLFGSETVITRDTLLAHGVRLKKLTAVRPTILDDATEAWGWRGVVSTREDAPITAEIPLDEVYPELLSTLKWAIDKTLESLAEPERLIGQERAQHLLISVEHARAQGGTLADFYRRLLPDIYRFVSSQPVEIESTQTTELLRFNRETATLPRFEIVGPFLDPLTAGMAREAYNEAIKGSEIYSLDRFMSGAIPFDLVIPGVGRGTIRVAPRAIVIMTPQPQFISLKKPVSTLPELAEAIERKFGPNCVLIGKAVTLIGMLAREFVFVFHEGASSYVKYSRKLHQSLEKQGIAAPVNPILRLRYNAWDALRECHSWLKLPVPLQRPFGTEELCAPSFASRWREVSEEQTQFLAHVKELRRPIDLIRYLAERVGASWICLAQEYTSLHSKLQDLESRVESMKRERHSLYGELRARRQARVLAEREKGEHWRAKIFEKNPDETDWKERERLTANVEEAIHAISETEQRIRHLLHDQRELARDPEVTKAHDRRRGIEREAELKRLRLIREAIIASKGLHNASLRPGAWWFPLLCPDGGWFKQTIATAECYLEPLR